MKICAGLVFGRLTTVSDAGRAADGHRVWLCLCECGAEVLRQTNNLQSSGVKHCGCAARELHTMHGGHGSPAYRSWQAAKRRCFVESDKDYPRYGGRGVTMCDEWRASFAAFFAHMGARPPSTTLERIDTNGNYVPGNCAWATATEQNRNRRVSVFVDFAGTRMHLSEAACRLWITYGAAFMRLKRGTFHANS